MANDSIRSIPGVCEVLDLCGAEADGPTLLLEVPHGATRASDYAALCAELVGDYPEALRDYFFLNTDTGAPEVAQRIAERYVAGSPRRRALVVRSTIPRTFVDPNRVIDVFTMPRATAAGEMTPGYHVWVREPYDRRLLFERYTDYVRVARAAYDRVCGSGGLALMVHTYAPWGVDVPVDDRIVERLHAAFSPEQIGNWPARADIDLIADDPDGVRMASDVLVERAFEELRAAGFGVALCDSYSLFHASMGYEFARAHPQRTLCIEVRRDLLVERFEPFVELACDPALVDRVAAAFAEVVVPVEALR